jgi:hypothetical protein
MMSNLLSEALGRDVAHAYFLVDWRIRGISKLLCKLTAAVFVRRFHFARHACALTHRVQQVDVGALR